MRTTPRRALALAAGLILGGAAALAMFPPLDAATAPVYQCFRPDGVARSSARLFLPAQPSAICLAGDTIKSWSANDVAPVTTTTVGTTTTAPTTTAPTTTTTPSGSCVGTALTGGQTQVAAAPTGTTFCLSGTHSWSLTPRSGQKFIGPAVLDGGGSASHAFNAVAPNVELRNLTIRNYDARGAGGTQDAMIHVDDSDSVKNAAHDWWLIDLDVSGSTADGSGSGTNWHFLRGRFWGNRIGGIMGAMGNGVTVDGTEIDHNNFTSSTWTTRNWSCGDEAGGIKWVTDNVTVTNTNTHDNACKGIWADLNANNAVITNNTVTNNWDEGIFYEISATAVITGNTVTHNGWKQYNASNGPCSFGWGGGITSSNSGRTAVITNGNVDIASNHLFDNCRGISVVDISGRDENGCPCDAANTQVHDNDVHGGGPTGAWTDRGTNLANQNIVFTRNTFVNATFCGLTC